MSRLSGNCGHYVAASEEQEGSAGYGQTDRGFLFASSSAATIINPIDEVLSALSLELAL